MPPPPDEEFSRVYNENLRMEDQVQALNKYLTTGDKAGLDAATREMIELFSAQGGGMNPFTGAAVAGSPIAAIRAQIDFSTKQIELNVDKLYNLNPDYAYAFYPEYFDAKRQKDLTSLLGGGGSGQAPPPQQFSFQIGPRGEIVRMGNYGAFDIVGTHPELAGKQTQVITDQTSGEAFALTLDADGVVTQRTSLGMVAFPDLDPQVKFKFDVLMAAAQVEANMAGLELQQRGQVLKAIGDDLAFQVSMGQMVYEEANTNLARINTAFTQRREERAQMLRYAVTRSSLRTNAAGETVTQLPFSGQLASILSQTTGRQFTEADFQLGVTAMNPDQTGRDVLASSAFSSPIPGLAASLTSSRSMIEGILGKQVGSQAASQQILGMAMPGGGA